MSIVHVMGASWGEAEESPSQRTLKTETALWLDGAGGTRMEPLRALT